MDDSGDTMWSFINTYVNSFAKWDLLIFFAEHDDVEEGAASLSKHLARSQAEIARALEDLAAVGILEAVADRDLGGDLYRLTRDDTAREQVRRFVEETRDRDTRLRVLTTLLRAGAR